LKKYFIITIVLVGLSLLSCGSIDDKDDTIDDNLLPGDSSEIFTDAPLSVASTGESEMSVSATIGPRYFYSIDEFEEAAKKGEFGSLAYYYRPQNIMDGAVFKEIAIRDGTYIAFVYAIPNSEIESYDVSKQISEEIVYQMYLDSEGRELLNHFLTEVNDKWSAVEPNNKDANLIYSEIAMSPTNMICYNYYFTVDDTMMYVRIPAIISEEEALRYTALDKIHLRYF